MNLQQLRFVKAVADTASFSKAADICCVSQPTLSNAIAQFEDEMGGKIFLRTTRKVSVTKFGEHLLQYVTAVLEAQGELKTSAHAFIEPPHKLLKIGFSPLVNMEQLTLALDAYKHDHSDVEIFFKECFLDDLEERLINETIDVVVLPERKHPTHHQSCKFYSEPLGVIQNDALDEREDNSSVQLKDIANKTLILTGGGCGLNDMLDDLYKSEGLEMKVYPGHALSYQILQEWANLGIGMAILPVSKFTVKAVQPLIHEDKPAQASFELVWNANTTKPQHISDLIEHFQDVVPSIIPNI